MNEGQAEQIIYHLSRIADRLGNLEDVFRSLNENFRENSADSAALISGEVRELRDVYAEGIELLKIATAEKSS